MFSRSSVDRPHAQCSGEGGGGVMGLIPVGDSDFFFVPCSHHLSQMSACSFLRNLFHAAILKLQDDDTAIPSMQWQQDFLKTWRSVMFHYCFICITLSCNGCPHYANNFHYYANSLCSQNVTIMLKKSHYYAQNFSPDDSFFT